MLHLPPKPNHSKTRKVAFGLVLAVIVFGLLAVPLVSFAVETVKDETKAPSSDSANVIGTFFITVYGIITGLIRQILYWVFNFVILPFIDVASRLKVGDGTCAPGQPPKFFGVVCPGWEFIRNFVNMLFILFLIVIGIATILRIQSYNYKRLLGMLVIMAILVNFSLVIAQAILKVADIMQAEVLGTASGIPSESVIRKLGYDLIRGRDFLGFSSSTLGSVWELLKRGASSIGIPVETRNSIDILASQFIQLMFSFLAFFVFAAIALFLMIRIVALWVLLILSPLAYALAVLPALRRFAGLWWSAFLKYALFAPIMFFFLRLAALLNESRAFILGTGDPCVLLPGICPDAKELGTFVFNNLQFLVILVFLFAGLLVARQLSIFGAGALMKLGQTAMLLPVAGTAAVGGFGAGALSRWMARGAERTGTSGYDRFRKGLSYLSPGAWTKGWKLRREIKEREAFTVAAAERADLFNRLIPGIVGRPERTDLGLRAMQARVSEERKNIHTKNREELAMLYDRSLHEKNPYKAAAFADQMAANYDLNELLAYRGYNTDHEGLQQMVEKDFVPLLGQERAYRLGYDLSRTAEEVHHWGYSRAFTGDYNLERGRIVYEPHKEAGKEVLVEISKLERRQQVGRGNRLAWGIQETDIWERDPTTGQMKRARVDKGWNPYGHERWAGETFDTEWQNQFNKNARMNIMLKHFDEALGENRELTLKTANRWVHEGFSDEQIDHLKTRVSRPEKGWAATEAGGKIFSIKNVRDMVASGKITAEELKALPDHAPLYEAVFGPQPPPAGAGGGRGRPGGGGAAPRGGGPAPGAAPPPAAGPAPAIPPPPAGPAPAAGGVGPTGRPMPGYPKGYTPPPGRPGVPPAPGAAPSGAPPPPASPVVQRAAADTHSGEGLDADEQQAVTDVVNKVHKGQLDPGKVADELAKKLKDQNKVPGLASKLLGNYADARAAGIDVASKISATFKPDAIAKMSRAVSDAVKVALRANLLGGKGLDHRDTQNDIRVRIGRDLQNVKAANAADFSGIADADFNRTVNDLANQVVDELKKK